MKQYRLLNKGEATKPADELLLGHEYGHEWITLLAWFVSEKDIPTYYDYEDFGAPIRREIILGKVIESNNPCVYCVGCKEKTKSAVENALNNCCDNDEFTGKKLFTMVDA